MKTIYYILLGVIFCIATIVILSLVIKKPDSKPIPKPGPGPSPTIVKISPRGQGMFSKADYSSIKTIDDIASRVGGSISESFRKFYDKYLDDTVKFICEAANNQDWSPDPNDLEKSMHNGEVYMSLQQVAYILSNFVLGNNKTQQKLINGRKVSPHNTLYDSHDTDFALICYYTALHDWSKSKDLDKIVVCYAAVNNNDKDQLPPTTPTGETTVTYNCVNGLTDIPNYAMRTIFAGAVPGGSYFTDVSKFSEEQEEIAFKLYPELAPGMFFLPNPESGSGSQRTKAWMVFGARMYNKPLPERDVKVTSVGEPQKMNTFESLHDYKMAPTACVGISANPCPAKCNQDKTCSACWLIHPDELSVLYRRAACFDPSKWPTFLQKISTAWKIPENWTLIGGRWGSGAWGCNSTYSLMVEALAATNGNWNKLILCGATHDSADGKCVCRKEGKWDATVYKQQLSALQKSFDKDAAGWTCLS